MKYNFTVKYTIFLYKEQFLAIQWYEFCKQNSQENVMHPIIISVSYKLADPSRSLHPPVPSRALVVILWILELPVQIRISRG